MWKQYFEKPMSEEKFLQIQLLHSHPSQPHSHKGLILDDLLEFIVDQLEDLFKPLEAVNKSLKL
jgi:predicted ATPase with chaperone activity